MFKPYEIVYSVHEDFRGLVDKVGAIIGKSGDYIRSFGYQPRTENPAAYGNPSAASQFVAQCRQYEAAHRGAGHCLSNRIHAALEAEFATNDLLETSQNDLQVRMLDETCDVQKWLARKELSSANRNELLIFDRECDEAIESIMAAKGKASVYLNEIETKRGRRSV